MRDLPTWDRHPLWQEMLTSGFQLLAEVSDDLLRRLAATERQYQLLAQMGIRSLMVVPLVARGTDHRDHDLRLHGGVGPALRARRPAGGRGGRAARRPYVRERAPHEGPQGRARRAFASRSPARGPPSTSRTRRCATSGTTTRSLRSDLLGKTDEDVAAGRRGRVADEREAAGPRGGREHPRRDGPHLRRRGAAPLPRDDRAAARPHRQDRRRHRRRRPTSPTSSARSSS